MCGIVGAVSSRNIVPILIEGLSASSTAATTPAASPCTRTASCAARAARRAWPSWTRNVARRRHLGRHRHRPHPLGHARRAGGAQRASALLARAARADRRGLGIRRPDRPGAQRHHREPRRAARRAAGQAATRSRARPTPRSSPTWSTTCTTATCSTRCSAPLPRLRGAYAIAVFCRDEPHRVVGARQGSPLVLGVGSATGENFLASDAMALAGVTDQIVYLEEGDVVDLQLGKHWIVPRRRDGGYQRASQRAVRTVHGAHRRRRARARTATTCRRRSSSSRGRSPTRSTRVAGISPELFGDGAYQRVQGRSTRC